MIAVVGSINTDLVLRVPRLPQPGETVGGGDLARHAGGKGANQATAASRLGADVALFGAVGDDASGGWLLDGLRREGVDVDGVQVLPDAATGLAMVWVDPRGENAIAVFPGGNDKVGTGLIDRSLDRIVTAEILLVQLEIPWETVAYLLDRLPTDGPRVILNPAPARPLESVSLPFRRIDVLTPNAGEMSTMAGAADRDEASRRLLATGIENIVCTAGADGAFRYREGQPALRVPAPRVDPVDTTGAGDAFNGALAWALQTRPLDAAIGWAVAAGTLATTHRGAQASLPTREAIEEFLKRVP